MSDAKPIAVVKAGSLSDQSKRVLQRGGYLVVESADLECVRLVSGGAIPLNATTIFHVAMDTIAGYSSGPSTTFGQKLAHAFAKETAPKDKP